MALDVVAKVFPPTACSQVEALLNEWLTAHRGVDVAFVTQSGHTVGDTLYLCLTVFYTEPTDRDRAIQAQMRAEDQSEHNAG